MLRYQPSAYLLTELTDDWLNSGQGNANVSHSTANDCSPPTRWTTWSSIFALDASRYVTGECITIGDGQAL